MKRVNPETLQMTDFKKEDTTNVIYMVREESCWDYEDDTSYIIFGKFEDAKDYFNKRVRSLKDAMKEWCEEDDIVEEERFDTLNSFGSYEAYQDEYYERVHAVLILEKKEVM